MESIKRNYIDKMTEYSALSWIFGIMVSNALMHALSIITFILWVNSSYIYNLRYIKHHKIFHATMIMVLISFIGCLYTDASYEEIIKILIKSSRLLILPIILTINIENSSKKILYPMLLAVIASYIVMILKVNNIISHYTFYPSYTDGPFRNRIYTGGFFSILVFLGINEVSYKYKNSNNIIPILAILLTSIYLIFFSTSRLGLVLIIVLPSVYLMLRTKQKIKLLLTSLTIAIVFTYIITKLNPSLTNRLLEPFMLFSHAYNNNMEALIAHNTDPRLFWYIKSLQFILESPIIGYGTGSVGNVFLYETLISGYTNNPHNQFLYIGIQFGVLGIFAFLYYLFTIYKSSLTLNKTEQIAVKGILIAFIFSFMINSWLYDFISQYFFLVTLGLIIPCKSESEQITKN